MLHLSAAPLLIAVTGPLYLDPGSGSVLLQVVLAAILGVGIAVRVGWSRIKALFTTKRPAETRATEDK